MAKHIFKNPAKFEVGDLKPMPKSPGVFVNFTDLSQVKDDDPEDVLESPAARIGGKLLDYDPLDEQKSPDGTHVEEAVVGFIKKQFDEKLHPRWPDGAIDPVTGESRAGQFMKKGQWFVQGKKVWQITGTSGGKIRAIEASGKTANVEHKTFTPVAKAVTGPGKAVPDVKPAPPQKFDRLSSPIVSPYAEPETHDPSIKLPEGSDFDADEWKTFGQEDQEYYVELMGRFGAWHADEAEDALHAAFKSYSKSVQDTIYAAFNQQYSSTGYWDGGAGSWLNLASVLKQSEYWSSSYASGGAAWKKYEEAKVALDEITEVVHWDLYNRTRAPDLLMFHGGQQTMYDYAKDHLSGKVPIYAGFSQSYHMSGATGWGNKILLTPTAIRYVALSQYTIMPGLGSWKSENELAAGVRMKLDDRSVTFDATNMGTSGEATHAVLKWLNDITQNQPAPGSAVQELKDVWAGKGNIPIPPPQPNLQGVGGSADAAYEKLPAAIAKKAGLMVWGGKEKMKYKVAPGDTMSPEASEGILEAMGLKPGDFIEGLQGTRYIIVEDPSDPTVGLTYLKIDPTTKLPDYNKAYQFHMSKGNKFRRLDGHIDIPKEQVAGFTPFSKEQYGKLAKGAETPVGQMKPGDLLSHKGEGFQIDANAKMGASSIPITSVDTGKQFTINGLYKAIPLLPQKDFVPPAPSFPYTPAVGDLVLVSPETGNKEGMTPYLGLVSATNETDTSATVVGFGSPAIAHDHSFAHLSRWDPPSPEKAEAGDFFYKDGEKWTVTTVWKNGTVRAKPHEGKVQSFKPSDPAIKGGLFRPGDWVMASKEKAKTFAPGDLISGSPKKLHPYLVVDSPSGSKKKIKLMNLETGEFSETTPGKSWVRLLPADLAHVGEDKPQVAPPPLATIKYAPTGEMKPFNALTVGEKFESGDGSGDIFEVTEVGDPYSSYAKVGAYKGGVFTPEPQGPALQSKTGLQGASLKVFGPEPLDPSSFDPSHYVEGDKVKLADMPVGTVFKSKTVPMVKGGDVASAAPKAHIAWVMSLASGHKSKKSLSSSYVTLVPKADQPFDYDALTTGDVVSVGKLKNGDIFAASGGALYEVVVEAVGDQDPVIKPLSGTHTQTVGQGFEATYKDHHMVSEPVKAVVPDDLPNVVEVGYDTYLHPKSGSNKYPKLAAMAEGTYFADKSGMKWLVKEKAADWVVVTDALGTLHKAAPNLRGKVSDQALFVDVSKPPTVEAQGGLVANTGDVTVGDLPVGGKFKFGTITTWTVQSASAYGGAVLAASSKTGKHKYFAADTVPVDVTAPASDVPLIVGKDLKKGQVVEQTQGPGAGTVWQVISPKGEGAPGVIGKVLQPSAGASVSIGTVEQMGEVMTFKSVDHPAADDKFFQSLGNGQVALYHGPQSAVGTPVKVSDNQTPGAGVKVASLASGAEWIASSGQLSPKPNENYKAKQLPPGSQVVAGPSGEGATEITKSGLVAKWGQPIPGSDEWTVTYVFPPDAPQKQPLKDLPVGTKFKSTDLFPGNSPAVWTIISQGDEIAYSAPGGTGYASSKSTLAKKPVTVVQDAPAVAHSVDDHVDFTGFSPGTRGDISNALNAIGEEEIAQAVDMDVDGTDVAVYQAAMNELDGWLQMVTGGEGILFDQVQHAWDQLEQAGYSATPDVTGPKPGAWKPGTITELPIEAVNNDDGTTLADLPVGSFYAMPQSDFGNGPPYEWKKITVAGKDFLKAVGLGGELHPDPSYKPPYYWKAGEEAANTASENEWLKKLNKGGVTPAVKGSELKVGQYAQYVESTVGESDSAGAVFKVTSVKPTGEGGVEGELLVQPRSGEKYLGMAVGAVVPMGTGVKFKVLDGPPEPLEIPPEGAVVEGSELKKGQYAELVSGSDHNPNVVSSWVGTVFKVVSPHGEDFDGVGSEGLHGEVISVGPNDDDHNVGMVGSMGWANKFKVLDGPPDSNAELGVGEKAYIKALPAGTLIKSENPESPYLWKVVDPAKAKLEILLPQEKAGKADTGSKYMKFVVTGYFPDEELPGGFKVGDKVEWNVAMGGGDPGGVKGVVVGPSDSGASNKLKVKVTDSDVGSHSFATPGKTLDPDSDVIQPVTEAPGITSPADPLVPYKYPKSGSAKYDKIGSLAPGVLFQDKTKKQYSVIGQSGGQTLFEDAEGNQFSTPDASRVKVVGSNEPPLAEGKSFVYSTNGSVVLKG